MWTASRGREKVQSGTDALFPWGYASRMAKRIVLSDAEREALAAADGTRTQPKMPAEIEARQLPGLIERREWPNGPLWRTPAGDRLLRAK